MTLSQALVGEPLIVESTGGDKQFSRCLAVLGIRPGQRLTLQQRSAWSGLVLQVGGLRLALDQTTARAIAVTKAPPAQAEP